MERKLAAGAAFPGASIERLPHAIADDVRLWRIDLDDFAARVDTAPMQPDEALRARAFRFERDRQRYLAGRRALRHLLAEALGCASAALILVADAQGKPQLAAPSPGLAFNLSHSAGTALIGVARHAAIGVDIELHRAIADADALARANFTPLEYAAWSGSAADQRDATFLRCWTRKEACLKAIGAGLRIEPHTVHVGCEADRRSVAIATPGGLQCVTVWSLPANDAGAAMAAVALVAEAGTAAATVATGRT